MLAVLSFAEVSKKKKREERREERGEGEEKGKGRLGERGRKEEETSAIKPFQDGRRQGVGANFRNTDVAAEDGILWKKKGTLVC